MTKRWKVTVYYYSPNMPDEVFTIDELSELQSKIEGGPDFRLIEEISILYNPSGAK